MKTSDPSTPGLFGDVSISSAEASPARTYPRQERVPGSEEHAPVSGARWRGSSPQYARAGASLRTRLLCALEELTGCSLTWRRRATTHGRWWWALGLSERRIGESASGLWPTATATQYGNNRGGAAGRVGPVRPSLEGAVRDWPTMTARDQESPAKLTRGAGAQRGGTPLVLAVESWPTPRGEDSESCGGDAKRHGTLTSSARGWPTPTEGDGKASGSRIGNPSTKAHPGTSLTDATVRGPLGQESSSERGRSRGSLNSKWVAQLMGFPPSWCELPVETTARLSRRTATRSSRKSRKRS